MQQVQDKLMFPIDTPSNKKLAGIFADEGRDMRIAAADAKQAEMISAQKSKANRKARRFAQKKARRAAPV